jgi:ribosomal protein L37AE/L43A
MDIDIELPQDEKVQKFFEVLKSHTEDQDDPISEWEYLTDKLKEVFEKKFCICSTPIQNIHMIRNKKSGLVLEIGSECAKKWDLAPLCECCKKPLGAITRRRKEDDWVCKACKAARKKEALLKAEARTQLLKQMGSYLFMGYFKATKTSPWYGRRYDEVVMVKELQRLTLKQEIDHAEYRRFREYLDLYRMQTSS